jgi:hypothetical protein
MIAARDLKYAAGVGENAFLHVLDPGAVHADRHLVLGFARHRAGVASDALAVIDYEAVFHRREFWNPRNQSYLGRRKRRGDVVEAPERSADRRRSKNKILAAESRALPPGWTGEDARLSTFILVSSLDDQVIDDVVRFVDMLQSAVTQSVSKCVVVFFGEIAMRLVEQFERSVIAARASEVGIDWGMIIQILPVIDRGVLDFSNGLVDLGDGVLFLAIHMRGVSLVFQMRAGMAQVGQGVQVGRMSSRLVGKGQCGTDCQAECNYGAMSCDLHSLLR